MFSKHPLGKVPCIEVGEENQLIWESQVICDYLDEKYPDKPLHSKDPFKKAQDRLFIDQIVSIRENFGRVFYSRDDMDEIWEAVYKEFKFVDSLFVKHMG